MSSEVSLRPGLSHFFSRRFKPLLIGFWLMVLAGCASQKPLPAKPKIQQNDFAKIPAYLSALIEREMEKNKITGLSIALVSEQRTVWQEGFGYAIKKQKVAVKPQTLFRAGSISKLLNALAVIQLSAQNRLDLDTPIHQYIPNFNINSRFKDEPNITLRHLLSHQSGLPSDLIKDMWVSSPPPFDTALDYLNQSYLSQPPGYAYAYSNLAHDVIGMIIEEVTGAKYQTYMNQLLMMLNMPSSRFTASPEAPPTALGYEKGKLRQELHLRDVPAAGLTSNVVDLTRLIALFSQKDPSSPHETFGKEGISTLLQVQGANNPLLFNKRIGLGLFYYEDVFQPNIPVVGHSGATVNHRSLIKLAPNHGFGVVVLSNSKNAGGTLHKIANRALLLMYEASTGRSAPKKPIRWPRKVPNDFLQDHTLEGHYATVAGLAHIYRKGNKLKAKLAGKTFRLYQRNKDDLYFLKYKLFGIFPINIGSIGLLGIAVKEVDGKYFLTGQDTVGNTRLLGEKVQPSPISEAWLARTGKYKIVNPLEVITLPKGGLKVVDGFLVAHAKSKDGDRLEFVLQPINDHEAIIAGIGRSLGETVFAKQAISGHVILEYSNILFKKVR